MFGWSDTKPLVVVDYAHTPDALQQVLSTLKPTNQVNYGVYLAVVVILIRLNALYGAGGSTMGGCIGDHER